MLRQRFMILLLWCQWLSATVRRPMMVQSLLVLPIPISQPPLQRVATRTRLPIQRRQYHWISPSASSHDGLLRIGGATSNDDATSNASTDAYDAEIEHLKSEITKYLQLRKEIGADDIAKEYVCQKVTTEVSI